MDGPLSLALSCSVAFLLGGEAMEGKNAGWRVAFCFAGEEEKGGGREILLDSGGFSGSAGKQE